MTEVKQDHELGWDDEITKESDFIILPEGDYDFTVTKFERGRYEPGPNSKIPACAMAKLEITMHCPVNGDVIVFHNLYLHTKTEGLLSAFFMGIGQKKKGEPLRMNWNDVTGAKGRAKVKVDTYTNNNGQQRTNNKIEKFYESTNPVQQNYQQPPQQMNYQQQPPMQQQSVYQQAPSQPQMQQPIQQGGYVPGQF